MSTVAPGVEVREARGVAEDGAEGERCDQERSSHGRSPSPAGGGAAALEEIGELVALPLVEGGVDPSQGLREPGAQGGQDLVLPPVHGLELLPVEGLVAQGDRQVAPRRLQLASKSVCRLPEAGCLVAEDPLLGGGRVDAAQQSPQEGARPEAAPVAAVAMPAAVPVATAQHADEQDETDGADDESEHVEPPDGRARARRHPGS